MFSREDKLFFRTTRLQDLAIHISVQIAFSNELPRTVPLAQNYRHAASKKHANIVTLISSRRSHADMSTRCCDESPRHPGLLAVEQLGEADYVQALRKSFSTP